MNYTPQDLIQFQAILDAFRYYTAASPYFDVLFTQNKDTFFSALRKTF